MPEKPLIVVDGDAGGGQFLRNGFALSAVARQPLRIVNIRAARKPPGLLPAHLQSIEMIATLCNAKVDGLTAGSMQVTFYPRDFVDGTLEVDTGSPSSLTLLAQIALPCLLFTPATSGMRGLGGTDVGYSPPFDELWAVFMPILARFGVQPQLTLIRRGFYPEGGGEIDLTVGQPLNNTALQAISLLEQGTVVKVDGRAFAAGEEEVQTMGPIVTTVQTILAKVLPGVPIQIQPVAETPETAKGTCSGLTLVAITDKGCRYGASILCEEKKKAEDYAQEVVLRLAAQVRTGACVDEWTQDQLIVYMAMAAGRSEIRVGEITDHTRSAIKAAETLLPCSFDIRSDGNTMIISCDGVGITSPGKFTTAVLERPKATALLAPVMVPFVPPGADPPSPERSPSRSLSPRRTPSPPPPPTPAPAPTSDKFINPFASDKKPEPSNNSFSSFGPPRTPQSQSSQPSTPQPFPFGSPSPQMQTSQNPFGGPLVIPPPPTSAPPPLPQPPASHPFGTAAGHHAFGTAHNFPSSSSSSSSSNPFGAASFSSQHTQRRSPSPMKIEPPPMRSRPRSISPPSFGRPQRSPPRSNPFGSMGGMDSRPSHSASFPPAPASFGASSLAVPFGAQPSIPNPFGQTVTSSPFGGVLASGEPQRHPSPPRRDNDRISFAQREIPSFRGSDRDRFGSSISNFDRNDRDRDRFSDRRGILDLPKNRDIPRIWDDQPDGNSLRRNRDSGRPSSRLDSDLDSYFDRSGAIDVDSGRGRNRDLALGRKRIREGSSDDERPRGRGERHFKSSHRRNYSDDDDELDESLLRRHTRRPIQIRDSDDEGDRVRARRRERFRERSPVIVRDNDILDRSSFNALPPLLATTSPFGLNFIGGPPIF